MVTVEVSWRNKRLVAGFIPRNSPNLQTTTRRTAPAHRRQNDEYNCLFERT